MVAQELKKCNKIFAVFLLVLASCSGAVIPLESNIGMPMSLMSPPDPIVVDVFFITDFISKNTVEQLRTTLVEKEIKFVVLNSGGGGLDDAIAVAEMIRDNQIDTIVQSDGYCMSACVLVFQSGKNRYAGKESVFLVHGTRLGKTFMDAYIEKCKGWTFDACELETKNEVWTLPKLKQYIVDGTNHYFQTMENYGLSKDVKTSIESLREPINERHYTIGNFTALPDVRITGKDAVKYNMVTRIYEY